MLSSFWGKAPQPAPTPPKKEEEPKITYRLVAASHVPPVVAPEPEPDPEAEPEPEAEAEPLVPGEKLVLLGVKVRPDTKKTLGELASLAGVTVSTYVRNVLERVRR